MNHPIPDLLPLTNQVFTQIRTAISLNMPFLNLCVFRLTPIPADVTLATDGLQLYFHPVWLLKRYQAESSALLRDYLHVLMHCIFRHPFVHTLVDQPLWNLACDMAFEAMICDLHFPQAATRDEARRQEVLTKLQAQVKPLTAEKLYHHFQSRPPKREWASLFRSDDHSIWYTPQTQAANSPNPGGGKSQRSPTPSPAPHEDSDSSQNSGDVNPPPEGVQNPRTDAQAIPREQFEQEWRDISEHIQMDLSTFAQQRGTEAGSLTQQLAELNRERYNYDAFLKKFATMGEVMKINDDEFDYIFYTYGLKHFGNMPLIEPLEYKEVKRIREFVIAIDTSGSTSGELVEKFLTKTYNILMSTENFFSRVNIHIIQCDASIQEAVKITSREEFEAYIQRMTIRGLGGTDFRPVFTYVDQLIQQHEFQHLKGLIYFTDGYGTFPESKPPYQAAFVFVQDEYSQVDVPPWAIRLILQENEI